MNQLTINIPVFREAFALAASWASKNKIHATLQCVLIENDGEKVTLKATNSENSITVATEGASGGAMRVLVPGVWFSQVLSKMSDDECTLTVDGKGIAVIKSPRVTHKFATQNADDFPEIKPTKGESHPINAELLAHAIKMVAYVCDTTASRFAFGGVFFEAGDNKLNLVASDGRRLAKIGSELSGEPFQAIVPQAACIQLARVLQGIPGDAQLTVGHESVAIEGDGVIAKVRLLEGRFPQWRNVVPKHSTNFEIHAGVLLSALDQASLAIDDDVSVGVDFAVESGTLSLTANTAASGRDARIEVPVACDDSLKFMLDCNLVRECLRVHKPDAMVAVAYTDGPIVFTIGDVINVIMCMVKE